MGVSNPGGLRQKDNLLLEQGPGIWSLAETHLYAALPPLSKLAQGS